MSKTLTEMAVDISNRMRALENAWNLPSTLIKNRKDDLIFMIEHLDAMAQEASQISQADAQALAAILKDVGIPYQWLFSRYKVSRAGELTNAELAHIRENIQAMAHEYRKVNVTA